MAILRLGFKRVPGPREARVGSTDRVADMVKACGFGIGIRGSGTANAPLIVSVAI